MKYTYEIILKPFGLILSVCVNLFETQTCGILVINERGGAGAVDWGEGTRDKWAHRPVIWAEIRTTYN